MIRRRPLDPPTHGPASAGRGFQSMRRLSRSPNDGSRGDQPLGTYRVMSARAKNLDLLVAAAGAGELIAHLNVRV
jgi:hypothetical protein